MNKVGGRAGSSGSTFVNNTKGADIIQIIEGGYLHSLDM